MTGGKIVTIGPRIVETAATVGDGPTGWRIASTGGRTGQIAGRTITTGAKTCGIAGKTAATAGPAASEPRTLG